MEVKYSKNLNILGKITQFL